jgi:CheY-like chemotaxis protein
MGIWGRRVVAVDDDRGALASLDALLRERGAELVVVEHAGSALATIIGVIPDVLCVAMAMPGLDGIGLLRKLRSLSPEKGGQIPAAAVTGGPSTERDRSAWRAAGFQRQLEKPFGAEAIIALGELAGHLVERRVASLERRQWPTPHDRRAERRIEPMTLVRGAENDLGRLELSDRELR